MSSYPLSTALMAVYYVVPIEFDDEGNKSDDKTQLCFYYVYNKEQKQFQRLTQAPMRLQAIPSAPSLGAGLGLDWVLLLQLSHSAVPLKKDQASTSSKLFSVTAKNLQEKSNCNPVPYTSVAVTATTSPDDMPSAVVPLAQPELRGVILIFSVLDSHGHMRLRSTSDPEIKGSTN